MTTEANEVGFLATEPSEEDAKTFATIDELLSCPGNVFLACDCTSGRRGKNTINYYMVRLMVNGKAVAFRTDRPYFPLAERIPNSTPNPDR